MELKKYITIYDDVLPLNALSSLLKFANKTTFQKATVGSGGTENFNIRRTYTNALSNLSNSMTECHWANLLCHFFRKNLNEYGKVNKIIDYGYTEIKDIEILKYEQTGFYTWHVDHFSAIPRTMSCILLLNNDYEGGNLCFNRMIVWPSNFLYPHMVKPVTKGTRYSVVAWAI